ncbi:MULTISPECIES: InlB B-repeat-containing protein [unclassified Collinsella]|uniref:InlB B-repeat-containing protein n=1 Tax=unclassified Collinsella TaxID=2637548 RepID=UPI003F8F73FE
MKIQVKETLARRRTVFFLTLTAIVGVCAFTFSGTQNYAWAEGEGPIATWNSAPEPGVGGVPATAGKNLTLEIKRASSSDDLEAFIMNNGNDPIPPSVLKLTTEEGSVLTARFVSPISPTDQSGSSIEGSDANTRFTKAELYETVTVTFNMNSHGTQIDPITVEKGTSVTLPQPTDPNYDFGGWFTDESLTTSFNGTAATSMTVYAKWTKKEKVTVSFESEFGTAPEAVTVNKGQVVELPDLGTDGDYTFVGWIMKGSEGTDPFIGEYTAKENITFTAVWEAPSTPIIEMVDVTLDMNGHGDSVTKQAEKGKPITLIDDPAAEGYTFKVWTYDKEGKQAFDPKKNADQDTTLYAQWEKNADSAPTNSTIPRTGDNQMALLASLCFSAAALIAVGIALAAYRKCKHV